MHTRPKSYGTQEHLDDVDYLIAHLGPDPVGAQFVPEVQVIRDTLSGRMSEWALAERNVAAAQAGSQTPVC